MGRMAGWLARRLVHPTDLAGWSATGRGDPRTPSRPARRELAGPWRQDGMPAHGLYEREREDGTVEGAAGYHGWMLWRWRGPRMRWSSPLVSAWNPILGQGLVLDELDWAGVAWPVDSEEWTAAAVLGGLKSAGYFALRPRSRMRTWVREARAAGIEVEAYREGCWAYAAQAGTLGERFDLGALAAEYRRVLPGSVGERAARELGEHAGVALLTAAVRHEEYPAVIRGLALGFPPTVTAALLAGRSHAVAHPRSWSEHGAYCPRCEGGGLYGLSWRRGGGLGAGASGERAAGPGRVGWSVPPPVAPTRAESREVGR